MTSQKYSTLIIIHVLLATVFGQESGNLTEICQSVKDIDQYLSELIQNPKIHNRNQIFCSIEEYIKRFGILSSKLATHTNDTLTVCADVFEEQGANFMHVRYDRNDLINKFQWGESELEEYNMWRGKTLDAWMKCEKYIYTHNNFQA